MKYEFHVGDYVEQILLGGEHITGYVNSYEPIPGGHKLEIVWSDGTKTTHDYASYELPAFFVRIGRYGFTKPEQSEEIEKLKMMSRENVWNERSGGWLYVQQCKINELVDAVNELRKTK